MATIAEVGANPSRLMRQVLYEPRTGSVRLDQVPVPQIEPGTVLVRNSFSVISPGTERNKVSFGEKNLLAKARSRPDLVRQVLQTMRREGIAATYTKVFSRLDMPEALGYCSAGVIDDVDEHTSEFKVGDLVACGGASASHAELILVPTNLCVRVPAAVSLEHAAFATLGAIALQGVRQAELRFGESVCIVGLGLVGILAAQLSRASGCCVFAVDLDFQRVALAKSLGFQHTFLSGDSDVAREISRLNDGRGVDSVIVAAHSSSNDPVVLAADLARDKGKVVVIGAVPMNLPRQPFYEKELDLRLSRSYGPGRYDELYERYGIDYPYAYVRWTERRNLAAFLDAIARDQVQVGPLISRRMEVGRAAEAYELVKNDSSVLSVVFEYSHRVETKTSLEPKLRPPTARGAHISVVGAGNFAQAYRLPYLKRYANSLTTIVTKQGHRAAHLKRKWGFREADTDPKQALFNPMATAVLIATRHDTHASLSAQALEAGKYVFVEKPLALCESELRELWAKHQRFNGRLMVGYNRRFAPAAVAAKEFLGKGPLLMNYRINNTVLPASHWLADPSQGGGRILGELCHFVDLFCFFASATPAALTAEAVPGGHELFSVTVSFSDGSVGTITHSVNGDLKLGKERIEIYSSSRTAVIDDFNSVYLCSGRKSFFRKLKGKGHEQCVSAFCRWISEASSEVPINPDELFLGTLATLVVPRAIASGSKITISLRS